MQRTCLLIKTSTSTRANLYPFFKFYLETKEDNPVSVIREGDNNLKHCNILKNQYIS